MAAGVRQQRGRRKRAEKDSRTGSAARDARLGPVSHSVVNSVNMANRISAFAVPVAAAIVFVAIGAWAAAQSQANPQRSAAARVQTAASDSAIAICRSADAGGTNASSTQKPQSKRLPAAIRATTRLVQVSAVVHDRHGNPITNLTKDDFVVLDEKKPQEIRIFSVETNQVPEHGPPLVPPDTGRQSSRSRQRARSSPLELGSLCASIPWIRSRRASFIQRGFSTSVNSLWN
jgi:hypothetical protein